MNLEIPKGEQIPLNFDPTPEDEYEEKTGPELLLSYKEKVGVPLRTGRYILHNGELDREKVIWAILNPIQERDSLLAEERDEDREVGQKAWWLK